MNIHEALSERMVIGMSLIWGFILVAMTIIILLAMGKAVPDTIAATILGALGSAIGVIVGATFRSDRVDEKRADTAAVAVTSMAAAIPAAPLAVPVTVTNPSSDPVPVAQTPEPTI